MKIPVRPVFVGRPHYIGVGPPLLLHEGIRSRPVESGTRAEHALPFGDSFAEPARLREATCSLEPLAYRVRRVPLDNSPTEFA
jgi:hypothetical protein